MMRPTFITLGPSGTCHENALLHYLEFQGLTSFELVLVEDLLEAIGQVREQPFTFLVQCSAHVQVHLVTERFHEEVFVVDTFIYPTKALSLLVRTRRRRAPRASGSSRPPAATSTSRVFPQWWTSPPSRSSPATCWRAAYDAGLTHVHHAEEHPDVLRVEEYYGPVDTTWVVYGPRKRFRGDVIGQRVPWLFTSHDKPTTDWMDNMELLPDRHHRGPRAPLALVVCLLLAAAIALSSCGSSSSGPPLTGTGYPNVNLPTLASRAVRSTRRRSRNSPSPGPCR